MKALILAAGNANKAQPLTTVVPKPMIPVVHKPAMELTIDQLRAHGFDEIVVSTSYLGSMIESYFRDGHRFGVRMAYSFEGYEMFGNFVEQALGGAGAMRKIHNHSGWFDDTFLVVRGDGVSDIDLTEMLRFHRERNAMATLALKALAPERLSHYGVAFLDDDGRVTEYADRPARELAAGGFADTGIYLFEPAVFSHIPADDVVGIERRLIPALLAAGAPVVGIAPPFQWVDIGQLDDYYGLVMRALEGGFAGFDLPGRTIRPGLRVGPNVKADFRKIPTVGPVYVGGSAAIADGCDLIGPVVVGAGAILEPGVRLESAVVLDYTRVAARSEVRHKVVGSRFCFCADGTVLDDRHTDIFWLFSDARTQAPELSAIQTALRGQ